MGEFRLIRLGEQLRDEISTMIMRQQIKDPRVSTFLTINSVEVVRDLSYAKVKVSSFLPDSQVEKGVQGLQSAAGFIQSTIAKKLRIRQFPKLTFVVDKSIKEGFAMVKKLEALEAEEAKIAASRQNSTENATESDGENSETQ